MRATLTFLGAVGTVTGSKYLATFGERRILVDAGLFQGEKKWRLKNWDDFPVAPVSISDIVITHAHLDHTGYLPVLVKNGFAGKIWMTEGTRRLAEIVLRDAAHLQEQEAKEANMGGYSKHSPALALYTTKDVEATVRLMRDVEYDRPVDLGDGITAEWARAAHILGSASIALRADDAAVVFSGDLGRANHPLLLPRDTTPPSAPYVVMESTYGDRLHPAESTHEGLADAIRRTIARGGSVLIPAFAIDRTELVLKLLTELLRDGRIPSVPVIVNSPMALSALDVYRDLPEELRPDISLADFANLPNLREARTREDSEALTRKGRKNEPSIIVSSSGMATGGRVVHHLAAMLPDPKNCVVLTGYQAVGTRGRQLIEGVRQLKMFGRYVPVKAEIFSDKEFSVHGDANDLMDWLRSISPEPKTVFVTHGEERASAALKKLIEQELGFNVVVPTYGEVVSLHAYEGYGVDDATAGLVRADLPGMVDPAPRTATSSPAPDFSNAVTPIAATASEASACDVRTPQRYRCLTGVDDAAFCRRVSEALEEGYVLYGSPALTFDGENVRVAQAVIWPS